ncbi:MAG: hypothetical protein AAGF12_21165 [Myxococcota bacterium]
MLRTFALLNLFVPAACTSPASGEPDAEITFEAPEAGVDGTDAQTDAPPDASLPTLGGPCATSADCGTGECFTGAEFPEGLCVEFCDPENATSCPDSARCTPLGFMINVCLPTCGREASCRPGYGCGELAPQGAVCAPGCEQNRDCPPGLHCNPADGVLGAGQCFDPNAAVGDRCEEPEDCPADAWCIRERDRGYPGGTCTLFRCDEDENSGCPGDGQCVFDFYRDSICLDGCAEDTDCRDGYACLPDETYPERLRCTPNCTEPAHCEDFRFRCDIETGRCVE